MLRLAVFLNFIILVIYSSLSQCLMIQNNYELINFPPQCSVSVGNRKTVDCKLKIEDVTDCCTDEQQSSPQHTFRIVNNTAIAFNLSLESIHMFYLTRGCTDNSSYCIAILIHVPMEPQVRGSKAVVEISKLPDFSRRKVFLRKTNVLVSDWDAKSFQHVHAGCDALYNTSMHLLMRGDSVVLEAQPSPGLTDPLAAELILHPCNVSCQAEELQNCEGRVVQVELWKKVKEPLLFKQLSPGSFYCVIIRHWDHLNCAIMLRAFEYRVRKELALSEQEIPQRNIHVILGVCSFFVALSLVCGAMLIGSFVRGRGMLLNRGSLSQTAPMSSTTSLPGQLRHQLAASESPHRILLLYSRDSPELCECMKALAKVLTMSTHAEVVDPLNDLWGVHTEKHREAGLTHWLYAVLYKKCSVLLLMTPGGKARQNAKKGEKLETVTFDPPNMLDDIFLLGLNYIQVQKAGDYKNVFQISLEGVGGTGETYNDGVPLAKYILPARLWELISALSRHRPRSGHQDLADETHHFYGCVEYEITRFKQSLENLKLFYKKNPQYTDRDIVSTVNMCSKKG